MNYIQIFRNSFQLIRTAKLVWVFGFLYLLGTSIDLFADVARGNVFLICLFFIIGIPVFVCSLIALGSLIYYIYQASIHKIESFAEVWRHSQSRVWRIIGFFILVSPGLILNGFITYLVLRKAPTTFVWLFIELIAYVFWTSVITFGLCAIMIEETKTGMAVWNSLLITLNNFHRVFIINGVVFLTRICIIGLVTISIVVGFRVDLVLLLSQNFQDFKELLSAPFFIVVSFLIDLILFPLNSVVLTLSFLQFSKEKAYPPLKRLST